MKHRQLKDKQKDRLRVLKERVSRIKRMPWYLEVDHAVGIWTSHMNQQAERIGRYAR